MQKLFVGRQNELRQFDEVLADPAGQAIVVVGQQGMGKTMLVNMMASWARTEHRELCCGSVRYEVTRTDGVEGVLANMMDDAYKAGKVEEGSFEPTEHRLGQWRAFWNVFKVGDLIMSLRRDATKNARDQFLDRLQRISEKMPVNGRALFIVDPEKYMQPDSDEAWALVTKRLPPKIKLIFAQRPDDAIASGEVMKALPNVVRIPEDRLDALGEQDVVELIRAKMPELGENTESILKSLAKYNGHPYAVPAALDLIKNGVNAGALPDDPTNGIAASQWGQIKRHSADATSLFKAFAILEVAVPPDIIAAVSALSRDQIEHLDAHPYLGGLLRAEADGQRIYHSLLADHVRGHILGDEAIEYHRRAIAKYRTQLNHARKTNTAPSILAADRLARHVLAADGTEAFAKCFVDECSEVLSDAGRFTTHEMMTMEALNCVTKKTMEAALWGNLAVVCRLRGDPNRAEDLHKKAFAISKESRRLDGMAAQLSGLGVISWQRRDWDTAEIRFKKSLAIYMYLDHQEGIANQCGNLALVYMDRYDLDRAEKVLQGALRIFEDSDNKKGMALTYENLGVVYSRRRDFDNAEVMHKKSLAFKQELGWKSSVAISHLNIGSVYEELGRAKEALGAYTDARSAFAELGMKTMAQAAQSRIDRLGGTDEDKH